MIILLVEVRFLRLVKSLCLNVLQKARRVIFFARYEASQLGSQHIDTEHLLLGLLSQDKGLFRRPYPSFDYEAVRSDIVARAKPGSPKLPVTVDVPLNDDAKRVLTSAADEAESLGSKHIGTEHLLLGMMYDANLPSAKVLSRFGLDFELLKRR